MSESSGELAYSVDGMPALEMSGRSTSWFEFWPLWAMYFPVVIQWLALSVRYRSATLPLIANPAVPLSGMVGVAKTEVLAQCGPRGREWVLPWVTLSVTAEPPVVQVEQLLPRLREAGIHFPLVAKPDIGCRGAGVKCLDSADELAAYIAAYPQGAAIVVQKLALWEPEAGVFYVRMPGEARGRITSLALKYSPYVVGDGERTLEQLLLADPRAANLTGLYHERHKHNWHVVIPAGQAYRLVFSASHSKGAIFRDGAAYISDELTAALDTLFDELPGYYYGRLDIKFHSIERLIRGQDFAVIEINGASSESIHIWDKNMRLWPAMRALFDQYATLFRIGNENRKQGHKPPSLMALWRAWRLEANLVRQYPEND
ncbi:MAG: D-alanine--D-alanine ligase [Spongiibacteraceae bacterium]|mgnify:CR=1 FL=1|nr:D-alanine--D-alanine ligase [Spongiibacteraceae bacterium]